MAKAAVKAAKKPAAKAVPAKKSPKRRAEFSSKLFQQGLEVRRAVLGGEYVDASIAGASEFMVDFQKLVTEYAWGEVWTRPGLSRKTRSMLNLGMLTALNRPNELRLHLKLLRGRVGSMTLADSSAGMLEVLAEKIAAHEAHTEMQACRLDLMADPLPAQRFDLIYTSMTLHHVPDTARILALFHDLLKPGGYLCIADLDAEDGSFHGIEYDVHHGFERAALAGLAQAAGLDAVRFCTVFEIVKEREQHSRGYPVFLMTAQRAGV